MISERDIRLEIRTKLDQLTRCTSSTQGNLPREIIGLIGDLGISDPQHPYMQRYSRAIAKLEGVPTQVIRPVQTVASFGSASPRERKPFAPFNHLQSKFKGSVEKTSVCVTHLGDKLGVCESYHGRSNEACRVGWVFDLATHMPDKIELFQVRDRDTFVFLKYDLGNSRVLYNPHSLDNYLDIINHGLKGLRYFEQARTLANFGFGLCKKLLRGIASGAIDDYQEEPLSGVVGHTRIMDLVHNNSTRYLNLREGLSDEERVWWSFPFSFSVAVR